MSSRTVVRAAVVAFLASRALIFLGLLVLSQIAFLDKVYSNSVWQTRIELRAERVRPELSRMILVGDGWWYKRIAEDGYRVRNEEEKNKRAFFPLYPLVVRACRITGDFAIDGAIVSNLAFLAALIALGQLALRSELDVQDAERVVCYVAFFPTSYFFSLPMTESVFLLLSVLSMFWAHSDRWAAAGLAGALAAATRVTGILLLPALLLLAWQRHRRFVPGMLWLALVPAGLAAFMGHLYLVTGDAFAFLHAQQAWGREAGGFWEPLVRYVGQWHVVGEPWNLLSFNFAVAVLLLVCAAVLLVRRDYAFGAYTLLTVLLALSSGSLQSIGRYAIVVFPLFFWLATSARSTLADRLLTAAFAMGLGWFLALLALRVDFTMA
jgi:Gpi18-like mannosyltransferase